MPPILQNTWECNWITLSNPICSKILIELSNQATITTDAFNDIDETTKLSLAITCLQCFVQENFLGPNLNDKYSTLPHCALLTDTLLDQITERLNVDGEEININVTKPELLVLSKLFFEHLLALNDGQYMFLVKWWYMRYLYVHQQVIEEATNTLYTTFLKLSDELLAYSIDNVSVKTLVILEIVQGFLAYKRIWKAEKYLEMAKQVLGVTLNVKGILGKRTQHQQKALPQLALSIDIGNSEHAVLPSVTHGTLPMLLKLEDDVRLEKITFESEEDNRMMEIPSLVQQVVLSIL